MTTTEKFYIHQTFRGITNIQQTVSDMLNRLITEAKNEGTEENYTELVVHLFPVWTGIKMFVYYNQGNDTFGYFYKNQYGLDSDRFCCVTREFMLAKILEEAKAVGGIRYIEIYL